jgi:hypothetical protein
MTISLRLAEARDESKPNSEVIRRMYGNAQNANLEETQTAHG